MFTNVQIRQRNKKGFTLVELVVTGVILLLLLGIGGGSIVKYQQYSIFKKNNDYARTIFSAAQSSLSYLKTGGGLEKFTEGLTALGGDDSFAYLEMTKDTYSNVIEENKNNPSADNLKNNKFYQLLKDYIADKTVMNAAIRIEFQKGNGNVTAVYYCDHAGELAEGVLGKTGDVLGIGNPEDEGWDAERKEFYLGYYGNEAISGGEIPGADVPLAIAYDVKWNNADKLTLTWTVKKKEGQPASGAVHLKNYNYEVNLKSGGDVVSLLLLGNDLWKSEITCKDKNGKGFPCEVKKNDTNHTITLLVDALDLGAVVAGDNTGTYSFMRFGLSADNKITAGVIVSEPVKEGEEVSFKNENECLSEKVQPLMGEDSIGKGYKVDNVRNLYNIRFLEGEGTGANIYTLTDSISWIEQIGNKVVYEHQALVEDPATAFLTIPELKENSGFNGVDGAVLSNFVLASAEKERVGLFGFNKGIIKNIKMENPKISSADHTEYDYIGTICGQNQKTILDSTVVSDNASIFDGSGKYLGGIAGSSSGRIENCTFEGKINNSAGSIGGIVGAANRGDTVQIVNCHSSGEINSNNGNNLGGIVGLWRSNGGIEEGDIRECYNLMDITEGSNSAGIVGNHVDADAGESSALYIVQCQNYGKPMGGDTILSDLEFSGILGTKNEETKTESFIKDCFGVSDVKYPIYRYGQQTDESIRQDELKEDINNYYFIEPSSIEPSSAVRKKAISAPDSYTGNDWVDWIRDANQRKYAISKMLDGDPGTRYCANSWDSSVDCIVIEFADDYVIDNLRIDWYGESDYTYEYSIYSGTEVKEENKITDRKVSMFYNNHTQEDQAYLEFQEPFRTNGIVIKINNSGWRKASSTYKLPGIWEFEINAGPQNQMRTRSYGAGNALEVIQLDNGLYYGCYTDSIDGLAGEMRCHPHSDDTNENIFKQVQNYLYEPFTGKSVPTQDPNLDAPDISELGIWLNDEQQTDINQIPSLTQDQFGAMEYRLSVTTGDQQDGHYEMQAAIYGVNDWKNPVYVFGGIPDMSGEITDILELSGSSLTSAEYVFDNSLLKKFATGDYVLELRLRKVSKELQIRSEWSDYIYARLPKIAEDEGGVSFE